MRILLWYIGYKAFIWMSDVAAQDYLTWWQNNCGHKQARSLSNCIRNHLGDQREIADTSSCIYGETYPQWSQSFWQKCHQETIAAHTK
jgi:hypothetical protein